MTSSQKIRLRLSQVRSRLNAISGLEGEAFTDEIRTEAATLQTEFADLEVRSQAAIVAEPAPEVREVDGLDAEMRERLELRSKATLTGFVVAAMTGRQLSGAEAEFSAAAEARGDVPIELFDPDPRQVKAEERVVTSAPGTVGVNIAPIQPHIFAPSIAAYTGVDMPRVQSGTFSQARIDTALSADSAAKGAGAVASAATFAIKSASPKRVSARLEILAEDVASAGVANFESALRQNLTMALSAELDDQMINGAGAGNDLEGLFHGIMNPSADGTTLTFAHGITKLAGLIDGLWATDMMQVRQIVGVDTYRRAASVFAGSASNKGERPLAGWLRDFSGGFRTNSRMPATASTKQQGLAFRSGVSGVRTAVCPHWGRIGITDIYSGSASAQTAVTFHVLLGDVLIIQPSAYSQTEYKVS